MHHPLLNTIDELVKREVPNFFRLYLNPYAVQACFCLARLVQDAWYAGAVARPAFQTFLANSFDEALSGALKLVRFCASRQGRPGVGLILDRGRLEGFASLSLGPHGRLELIPDLTVVDADAANVESQIGPLERFGYVVLTPGVTQAEQERLADVLSRLARHRPLVIAGVDRPGLEASRRQPPGWRKSLPPDVVVFDETFVHHHVPFGAFTARKELYDHWNRRGYATFHSTTFQPNTISTLHLLRCLEEDEPRLMAALAEELVRIAFDQTHCKRQLRDLYSPSLARMMAALGFDTLDVRAAGHYVKVAGRRVFDGVAGIASSVRGHNPPNYVSEIAAMPSKPTAFALLRERLRELTGLDGMVPSASGASAVENALRLGLAAGAPRKHVLALNGGFGGKTLFALTGTAKPAYKEGLGPLYPNVLYVDPFAADAVTRLEAVLERHAVAVVELELVQAVGGVRAVPEHVIRFLDEGRHRHGYALFVDEVQTGMYRTGPFTLCERHGLKPDLLTVGKGTSDMLFPFALTLYSKAIAARVGEFAPGLPGSLRAKADYEIGYQTVLNTLDRARTRGLAARVQEAGALFEKLLTVGLASCPVVRDVRTFGLLIGIELDASRSFGGWFKKQAPFVYLLNMLQSGSFPLLVGYCQYEPNVLKLTPPLSVTREEIERICATIVSVLKAPPYGLLSPAFGLLARSYVKDKWKGLVRRKGIHESVAR